MKAHTMSPPKTNKSATTKYEGRERLGNGNSMINTLHIFIAHFLACFLAWCNIGVQKGSAVFEAHVPALRESLLVLRRYVLGRVFPPTPPNTPLFAAAGPAAAAAAAAAGPALAPAAAAAPAPAAAAAPPAAAAAASDDNSNREQLFPQSAHQVVQANSAVLDGLMSIANQNQALTNLLLGRIQDQGVQIGGLVLQGEEHAQQIRETSEGLHGVQSRVVSLEREGRDRDVTIKRLICGIVLGIVFLFLKKK